MTTEARIYPQNQLPDVAIADYKRGRSYERAWCIAIVKRWFGGDSIDDRGYECVREIESDRI